ncbi:endolysin [Synechococcus phage S-CREM2]|nr:endolysin [Synechococcus phage S-CREM2]
MAEAKETQNILKQIYSSSSSMSKTSEGNTSTLESIYKLQLESEKRRRAAQVKADREARRKLQDDKRDDLDAEKEAKEGKKEVTNVAQAFQKKLGDAIKGLLGGIGKVLLGALGPLLPGIINAMGLLKGGLMGALSKVGGLLGKGFGLLKGLIGPALMGLKSLLLPVLPAIGTIAAVGGAAAILAVVGSEIEKRVRNFFNGGSDVTDAYSSVDKQLKEAGLDPQGRRIERRGSRYFTSSKGLSEEQEKLAKQAEIVKNRITEIKRERKTLNEKRTEEINKVKEKAERVGRAGSVELTEEQREEIESINRKYDELQEEVDKKLAEATDTDITTIEVGGKENVAGTTPAPAPAPTPTPAPSANTGRSGARRRQQRLRRQSGGAIPGAFTVPGSGSGDQFPIDLPAGSFVLNRNASDVLRQGLQRGGMTRMVPTLLEPGERVFLPGQWENSGIAQLNRTFSRFQVGGEVSGNVQYLQSGGKTDIKSITTSNNFINNSQRGGDTNTSETITTNLSKLINKLQEGGMTTFTGGATNINTSASSMQSTANSMVQQGDTSSISSSYNNTVGGTSISSATNVSNTASTTDVSNSSNTTSSATNVTNTSSNTNVANSSSTVSNLQQSSTESTTNNSTTSNTSSQSTTNNSTTNNNTSSQSTTNNSTANNNTSSESTTNNSTTSNTSSESTTNNSTTNNTSSESTTNNTTTTNNNTSSETTTNKEGDKNTRSETTTTKEGDVSNVTSNSSETKITDVTKNIQGNVSVDQSSTRVQSNDPSVPPDPRVQSTTDFIKKETKQTVTQMLKSGGLVIFQGHGDVPSGSGIAPGTDGPGTPIQGKYKPTAEQHFVHQVATQAEQLAKKQNVNLTYQRSLGRYKDASNPNSNWSQIKKHRAEGKSAVEIHFDAWGYDRNKNYLEGKRGMLSGGQGSLLPEEKALQQKFGTHPSSGSRSWGSLMLELDPLKFATSRVGTYAQMLVDSAKGDGSAPGPSVAGGGQTEGGEQQSVQVKRESGSARGGAVPALKVPTQPMGVAETSAPQQTQTQPTQGQEKPEGQQAQGEEKPKEQQTGVKAIVAAAEKGAQMQLGKGVNMQCANTTRQVLRMAGHPDAGKTTKKGDLDAEGLKYSAPTFAASFAGTDMGTIKKSTSQLAPGDVVLWKNTFSSMGGDKPGAITHVGIKGEGNDVYDHGMGPGWRKRAMWDGGKFAYGVTLSGNGGAAGSFAGGEAGATGAPGAPGSAGGSGTEGAPGADGSTGMGSNMSMLQKMAEKNPQAAELVKFLSGVTGVFAMLTGKTLTGGFGQPGQPGQVGQAGQAGQPGQDGAAGGGLTLGGGAAAGGSFGESALIQAMNNAGMTDKTERAIFLAQMAHETGNFKYQEEIHDGSNYEGRTDLGNTQPGDGKRYKGRGYIQITGRFNYDRFGKMIGQDLVNNPELAADPNIAAQVALAYWKDRNISGPARQGDNLAVTRLINGGTNGLADRNAKYEQYKRKGLQTGGVVNMSKVTNKLTERMQTAQEKYNEKEAKESNNQPIVVTKPSGGGGGPTAAGGSTASRKPPVLPEDCAATMTADYTYNVSLGGY